MPTYEYKCKDCDHRFEVSQRITEEPLTDCPECSGIIKRVLFPAGVVFKGSGWYVTDYRNNSEKAKYDAESKGETAPASKPTETKSDAKTETKTESKSEAKTETKSESKTDSAAKAA